MPETKVLEERKGGKIVAYGTRGMWVPDGMTVEEIVAGGRALWESLDFSRETCEMMATNVLRAAKSARDSREGG